MEYNKKIHKDRQNLCLHLFLKEVFGLYVFLFVIFLEIYSMYVLAIYLKYWKYYWCCITPDLEKSWHPCIYLL